MKRYVLVAMPKNLDAFSTVAEFRAANEPRHRWVYQAVDVPLPGPVGGVGVPGNRPHPIFVDDTSEAIEDLAHTMAQAHPQFQWCIFDLITIVDAAYADIKVVKKKVTDKGLLP